MLEYADAALVSFEPPRAVRDLVARNPVVVSSDLTRARRSAELSGAAEVTASPLLDEAPLPHPDVLPVPLPWNVALVTCRVMWRFGYARNAPGIGADRARAARAADWLERLVDGPSDVVAFGHGIMHRLIARHLRERGWVEEGASGGGYWSCGTMRRRSAANVPVDG